MDTNNTPGSDPQKQSNEFTKKRRAETLLTFSDEKNSSYSRFLVASAKDGQPIKLSIFGIQKLLLCAVGEVKEAKKIRGGGVLIEVVNKQQSENALKMTMWVDQPVTVTPHRSLNTSRGVIRCRDLRDCNEAEILNALYSQDVVQVKHIMTKRGDKLEPTNTFILDFNLPAPPKYITAAYLKINVEPFIPNPLRCYNCQRFGHGKSSCNRVALCAKCGQEGHQDTLCTNPPHCTNCSGSHAAYSKECPVWNYQRQITQTKFSSNISFYEAKQLIDKQNNNHSGAAGTTRPGVSYAGAAAPRALPETRTCSAQTDLTWPLTSEVPVSLSAPPSADVESQTESPRSNKPIHTASETHNKNRQANSDKNVKGPKTGPVVKTAANRGRMGSKDTIKLFNKYGTLEDVEGMDLDTRRSESVSPRSRKK
jgi:hypothetical protein